MRFTYRLPYAIILAGHNVGFVGEDGSGPEAYYEELPEAVASVNAVSSSATSREG
jgi:hypothetical protein